MKVLLNIGTHGDEKIGLYVAQRIEKLPVKNNGLVVNVANEKAFKLNKRFIDQDLNRSFPGKKKGNYEERRAHQLLPIIQEADIVIDIHSTTSELKDAIIVTKLNKKTREYVNIISPKYVLVMNATKNNTLISHAKIGIAFEYGKDKDQKVIRKVTDGIESLLSYVGMIPSLKNRIKIGRPIFLDVYASISKPKGARLGSNIKNYVLVKKGSVYGTAQEKQLRAEQDFYPVLFGAKNYKDIFGFAGKKMS